MPAAIRAYDFVGAHDGAIDQLGANVLTAQQQERVLGTEIPLIAVVDDDAGMRQSLEGLVRSLGYRAALFESAEHFLAAPEALSSCCVISDLQMSGMSGIELAHSLGERLKGRVILISAFLDERVRILADEAGVRCFLRKPFDGERLIGCIEAALAG